MIDLGNQPFLVDVGGINGADLGTGRIITMHAGSRKESSFDMRVLSFNKRNQFDPMNGAALF
jgi:hypothetical protein